MKPGVMVPEHIQDGSGRTITKWHGDPSAWMSLFQTGGQVGYFIRPEGNRK